MADVRSLLILLRRELERLYGNRLAALFLFGSYARGEADAESDLDVLIVLRDFDRYGAEVDVTSHIVADLSLKNGVTINSVFVRERDWQSGESGFLRNVREEAIAA